MNVGQYDVVRLRHGETVVILQHDTFSSFKTRVVAPLIAKSVKMLTTTLNPVIRHARKDWVLGTHLISVIPLSAISARLGSVEQQEYTIKRAVDQLFLGV